MARKQLTPLDLNSNKIINVASPTSATDVATRGYIDTTAVVRVVHGSTAGTARPSGATHVEWVGSVAPTNATNNDTWIDTA